MAKRSIMMIGAAGAAVVAVGVTVALMFRPAASAEPLSIEEPTSADLDAFAGARILFGHQSVGSNVLSGVELVFADSGASAPAIIETESPVATDAAFLAHAHVGVNGDPWSKFEHFSDLLRGPWGDQAEFAMLKLCYADIVASTDVDALFRDYSALMSDLEAQHPDVTFLYATVPLTTDRSWKANLKALVGQDDHMGPDDNVARHRFNELVREKYASTGRLFDIAAVESAQDQDPTARDRSGDEYFVLHEAFSSDAGHLNDDGARAAAGELIRVVAANRR